MYRSVQKRRTEDVYKRQLSSLGPKLLGGLEKVKAACKELEAKMGSSEADEPEMCIRDRFKSGSSMNYFRELLDRIREIRLSERLF